jgi:hypothetical protein
MFNVRPDARSPWLCVEPPPADEVPGFRINPDGSVRGTRRAAPPGSFGFDPSAGPSPSMGTGFQDAMRFAPGNVHPDAHLTGLSDFAPPPRHPLQDALDQIMGIYAGFGTEPRSLDRQRSAADIVGNRFPSPYASDNSFPQVARPAVPLNSMSRIASDDRSMAEAAQRADLVRADPRLIGSGGGSFSPTGREHDIQQVSLTDRPSETQEEREKRIFKVPIPRPDIPMHPPFPPPFHIPLVPILPPPEPPPRPPEAPPPAPGNRIALRPTRLLA